MDGKEKKVFADTRDIRFLLSDTDEETFTNRDSKRFDASSSTTRY